MEELQQDNLQEIIAGQDLVLVQYGAGWCGSCKIMKPKLKKMASENTNAKFYYVDAEKFPLSRQLAKVDNLPTFVAFKKGQFLNQIQTNKADSLKQFIDEVTTN